MAHGYLKTWLNGKRIWRIGCHKKMLMKFHWSRCKQMHLRIQITNFTSPAENTCCLTICVLGQPYSYYFAMYFLSPKYQGLGSGLFILPEPDRTSAKELPNSKHINSELFGKVVFRIKVLKRNCYPGLFK